MAGRTEVEVQDTGCCCSKARRMLLLASPLQQASTLELLIGDRQAVRWVVRLEDAQAVAASGRCFCMPGACSAAI